MMIFVSSLAFVGFLAALPNINRYLNLRAQEGSTDSFFRTFGKGIMYVLSIFTQHGNIIVANT